MKLLTCFIAGIPLSLLTTLMLFKTSDASFPPASSHGSTCKQVGHELQTNMRICQFIPSNISGSSVILLPLVCQFLAGSVNNFGRIFTLFC